MEPKKTMSADSRVAIIGMGCRLPGDAASPESFWELLIQGRSAWSEVPPERWNNAAYYHPNGERKGTTSVKGGHFISGNLAHFDAPFFSITPSEAKTMDPQQRMLLEVTYEALDNAGIRIEDMVGSKTSCFVGDFSSRDFEMNMNRDTENSAMQQLSGNTMSIMSNRISYFFDLQGPSMTVDTACSSGLVALHLACQSIKSGESEMAIVGGVSLMQSPDMTMALDALHLLSPDGKSYAFDSRANGYGRGEGFAVVILKPEYAAMKDNDTIRAIVRGSGCNHDGKTRGLHLPSAEAQETLIRETYTRAGVDMKDTAYCEAHGTGTAAGDPLEARALAVTLGKSRESSSPLMIGSVKTNIGHLEGAAGLASVLKTVLALERGIIPPSVNFKTPTPRIPFASNNLEVVVTESREWPEGVRRASINSFGFGGTNSHVILEAANPARQITNGYAEHNLPDWVEVVANGAHSPTEVKQPRLFCWSAHDEKGIARLCEGYAQYMDSIQSHRTSADNDRSLIDDLWYTLAYRRSNLNWKSWCLASTTDELCQKLKHGVSKPIQSSKILQMAFVFTGQGAQWYGMGRELWTYKVYRESIQQADAYLTSAGCPWSVIEELNRNANTSKLNEAIYSQPLCTVIQVALVQLLRSWNIHPRAVVGHSSGEIAAAYCTGALSSESAWKLAYQRGRLSNFLEAGSGAMMSVGLGENEANKYLDRITRGKATVACINSPSSVTVSGDVCALDQLDEMLKTEGVFARRLKVEVAYHSHHMKAVAKIYLDAIKDVTTESYSADPEVRMFSSVTGNVIDPGALTPEYWVANLVSQVRFSDAVQNLSTYHSGNRRRRGASEKSALLWLEVGPHGALATPVKQTLDDSKTDYLSILHRGQDAICTALAVAGELWSRGHTVDFASTVEYIEARTGQPAFLVDAPTYPWNHGVEYWSEPRLSTAHRFRKYPRQDLLGSPVEGSSEPAWRHFLRMSENPWMEDHQIRLNIPYCSAGLMTMAVEGAKQLTEDAGLQVSGYELRDVHFLQPPLIPPEEDGIEVVMKFRASTPIPEVSKSGLIMHAFVINSLAPGGEDWQRNCSGKIVTHVQVNDMANLRNDRYYMDQYEKVTAACKHEKNADAFYIELAEVGMGFGVTIRNLIRISSSTEQSSCTIRVPDTAATMPENFEYHHAIHPALLESLTHVMIPALTGPKTALKETLVPAFVESVYIANLVAIRPGGELRGYATAKWHDDSLAEGNIIALDPHKIQPLVIITKMQCKVLPPWDVGSNEWQPAIETSTKYRKLCNHMSWKVDPESFRPNEYIDLPNYFDCLFHKTPTLKILQVGGNPADVTTALLQVATSNGSHLPLFSSLTFTAESAKAIADAGIELAKWNPHVRYEMLNVEEDLTEQNFELGLYDLVIADATALTPKLIERLFSHISALMKPKGTLLIEADINTEVGYDTSASITSKLGNCTLNPVINDGWKRILIEHGFASGPILYKDTSEPRSGRLQMIAATTAANNGNLLQDCGEAIIVQPADAGRELAMLMTKTLERLSAFGFKTAIVDMSTAIGRALESCIVVNMVETKISLLSKMEPTAFENMKSLVLRSKSLLWLTAGGIMTGENPAMNMVTGFARTLRYETNFTSFATLDLGFASQLNDIVNHDLFVDAIGRMALSLCEEPSTGSLEREFACHKGQLYTPRVRPLEAMNEWMNGLDKQVGLEKVRLDQIDYSVQVASKTEDDIEEVHFKGISVVLNSIGHDQVQIDVKASGSNMADLMAPTESMGLECAGVITKLGRRVRHLRKGDRVMAIGPGCHRNTVVTSEDLCQRISENTSFEQGATIPFAYCTAFLALVHNARVKVGESVLIHECPDGVDQAAAEIALHLGAEVFVFTTSLEKRTYMIEQLHIAETHVLELEEFDLSRNFMRMTQNKGFDVVIGNSSGEIMRQSWHCIARYGRFVRFSIGGGLKGDTEIDMRPFKRCATFSSVDVMDLLQHDPDEVSGIFREVRCLLDEGKILSLFPITKYNYDRIQEWFETLSSGKMEGKSVLSAQSDGLIPFVRAASKPFKLNPDSSYLLPGGLGGLGRNIAQWLTEHGARSLIFLSRSGAHNPETASFVADFRAQGVQVGVYQCDISNLRQLEETIAACKSIHAPIRGVIQCAMNLRDSAFENMTADDWQAVVAPKVQGSWNLHTCLPQQMDFFIMLASFVGVTGNRGQANYAAANAYQDALALHRRARGLPATSIDLGWMHDIGVVADVAEQMFKLRNSGFEGMREHEMHTVLEAAVTGKVRGKEGTTVPSQVITGICTGGMIERSGAMDFGWMNDPKFSYLKTVDSRAIKGARNAGSDASVLKRRLREASTRYDVTTVVKEALMAKLIQSTGLDVRDVDENKPIHALGLDSVVAIEIRGWAKRELKADVSGVFILGNSSIKEVAATMAEGSGLIDKRIWQ